MTTIVFRDGILAADTQLTEGSMKTLCRKIDVWPDGRIAACAGNGYDYLIFREYILGNNKKKSSIMSLNKNFEAILIDLDGVAYDYNKHLMASEILSPYRAIGSGYIVASAGMLIGMDAISAVEFAGELDVNTNSLVDSYNTKTKKLTLCKWPKRK